ncbi:MAG: hypothetical protein JSR72_12015 [Proteobacteria bacterium]|nr:hypothetical protein [Pseudomonadota bacterium]
MKTTCTMRCGATVICGHCHKTVIEVFRSAPDEADDVCRAVGIPEPCQRVTICDGVSVDRMAVPGTLTAFLRAVPFTSPVTPGAAWLHKCTKATVGASMSKKDDASKTLKKKLKKLKKLQAEIAELKAAVDKSKCAKLAGAGAAKDKKSAKAAGKKTKRKAKKAKPAATGDGKAAPATVTKATPSLVRPEPVKTVAKEATSVPAGPSARVATG